jgi:hypothetical protein
MNTHSWHQLRALKTRLTSTNDARALEIERQYYKLCRKSRDMNIETWLDDWQTTYTNVKSFNIVEMIEHRSLRDFLMIITEVNVETYLTTFSDNHLIFLHKNKEDTNMYELIEDFRAFARMRQDTNIRQKNHFAFAAERTRLTFNDQSSNQRRSCLCEAMHRWNECLYLFFDIRLNDWTTDPIIQARVDETLSKGRTRAAVEASIQSQREYLNKVFFGIWNSSSEFSFASCSEGVGKYASEHFFLSTKAWNQGNEIDKDIRWCLHQGSVSDWGDH